MTDSWILEAIERAALERAAKVLRERFQDDPADPGWRLMGYTRTEVIRALTYWHSTFRAPRAMVDGDLIQGPYPFCRMPFVCKGYCKKDPACND